MQIIITKKEILAGQAGFLKLQLLEQELGLRNTVIFERFEDIKSGVGRSGSIQNDGEKITISLDEEFIVDSIVLATKVAKPYVKMIAALKLALAVLKIDTKSIEKKVKKFQKKWG